MTVDTIVRIRIDQIRPDPNQPRKVFDQEKLEALALSLRTNGLLQPISVRPDGDGYIIIAGERRWRASQLIGWEFIDAIVRADLSDHEAAKLQLLENVVRADLDPVEEAQALSRMQAENFTLQELADAVGMSVAAVEWRIEMLAARDEVLHLVRRGHLPPSTAWSLGRLNQNNQLKALRMIDQNGLDSRAAAALCDRLYAEENQVQMFEETKLSSGERRAVRSFSQAFADICKVLSSIEKMRQENPDVLAAALMAEGAVVDSKISEAIRGLNRVKRAVKVAQAGAIEGA